MATISSPINRPDQVQPFTPDQVARLLEAAAKSKSKHRDIAILYLLLDSGMRVTEMCGLKYKHIDMQAFQVEVEGKGGKKRMVAFGRYTRKALWDYLREREREPEEALFLAEGGHLVGEPLTRNGVYLMFRRLGRMAGLDAARCSPHTARHTFAIEFLRNGGNQFTLMAILGHTDTKQTNIYVQVAEADISAQHRIYSPIDRMKKKKTPL